MTAANETTYVFRPQPGPQTAFLSSSADIVVYGGGAGSGKSYGLSLAPLRHHKLKNATMAIFRRERPRIINPGGLWDEAAKIYPHFGGESNLQRLVYKFPESGATISFCSLPYDSDVKKYHGSQIMLLMFDELTEFTEYQFWYMLSRNRSDTGVRGYVRATCNPDSESWVKDLIAWWIGEDGYPIASRSGAIRWFCRINGAIFWANTKEELIANQKVQDIDCKSFTFIPATIEDNQILLQNDPGYVSNLRALGEVEKQRLLFGNWKIKKEGKIFRQQDFIVFTRPPAHIQRKCIYVDTATKTKEHNDYSVLQCWVKGEKGIYLIDQVRGKFEYPDLKRMFIAFVSKHRDANKIFIEDSNAGTSLLQECEREIQRTIEPIKRSKDKFTRAYNCQGYVQGGYVLLNCLSDYYTDFISEATSFTADGTHAHDDQIDCMLDAIDDLLIQPARIETRKGEDMNLSTRII